MKIVLMVAMAFLVMGCAASGENIEQAERKHSFCIGHCHH